MSWRVKRHRPTLSPTVRFRRSRLGSHLGQQDRTIALATLHAYGGQSAQALAMLETLRQRQPLDRPIQLAIKTVKQLSGDFSPAQWQDARVLQRARADVPHVPLWDGTPLAPGETLMIWDIDTSPRRHRGPKGFGLGDIIQLSRMLAPAKAQSQAAQVIFHVPTALTHLMRSLSGPDVIVDYMPASGFDKHLPLVLTPSLVPLTDAIFSSVPYLHASPESIDRWRPTFADKRYTHIGIHYAADPKHQSARERSIPLKILAPLFEIPNTRWYAFQRGAAADVATYPQLIDLGDIDTDAPFMETAGALHHLDFLLACNSGLGHLAGALRACRVWMLLNFFFDARWCAMTGTTPWYPHHRLFQQEKPGAWEPLMELVRYELEHVMLEKEGSHEALTNDADRTIVEA